MLLEFHFFNVPSVKNSPNGKLFRGSRVESDKEAVLPEKRLNL